MNKFHICLFLLLLLALPSTFALACNPGEAELTVDITPDAYPLEISWQVNNYLTGLPVLSGNAAGGTFCLPKDNCYDFTIYDLAGDGICCYEGGLEGEYSVYFNGNLIISGAEYSASEYSGSFGCPNGKSCSSALQVPPGFYNTPFPETWYKFTPTQSGLYSIGTCYNNNICHTAIWVYDYCLGLPYTNNLEGAIKFNSGGCNNSSTLAATQVNFVANNTYYIRIGHIGACSSTIFWELEYLAPITDCTDPTACNYNPFAEISDPNLCEYAGGNDNCPGPDFWIDQNALRNSMYIGYFNSSPQDCYLNEGCVNGVGLREVLRFDTKIHNIGQEDFYLGAPNSSNPLWVFDNCHQHFHFENYAKYTLYNQNNIALPSGYKTGFCLEDSQCPYWGDYKFSCNKQGLTKGCYDLYAADINCQWMDITDLEPGLYSLVVQVNFEYSADSLGRYEEDYTNNWAQVCFELFRDAQGAASFEIKTECALFVDCMGQAYGEAVADCTGTCNGTAKYGDIDANNNVENADFLDLIDIVKAGDQYFPCFDVSGDGNLDIYDLALLNTCVQNTTTCNFPISTTNSVANVAFSFAQSEIILSQNNLQEWAEISLVSPDTRLSAFEISIENAFIEDYELLIAPDKAEVFVNAINTSIMVVYTQDFVPLLEQATPLLRLKLSNPSSNQICFADNVKAVSQQMNLLSPTTSETCINIEFPSANDGLLAQSLVNIYQQNQAIFIQQKNNTAAYNYTIYNVQGNIIQTEKQKNSTTQIATSGFAAGVYILVVETQNTLIRQKIVVF